MPTLAMGRASIDSGRGGGGGGGEIVLGRVDSAAAATARFGGGGGGGGRCAGKAALPDMAMVGGIMPSVDDCNTDSPHSKSGNITVPNDDAFPTASASAAA